VDVVSVERGPRVGTDVCCCFGGAGNCRCDNCGCGCGCGCLRRVGEGCLGRGGGTFFGVDGAGASVGGVREALL
jgi:hypothetical protein